MTRTVEFHYDYGSPAAYLAWTQLPRLAQETGATVDMRPLLLGGVFQATGNRSPVSVPAKGRYVFEDFARFARRYGVPLNPNPHFIINTLVPMRAAIGLQMREPHRLPDFDTAMFRSIWIDAQNLNDPEVVARVWSAAGFDAAALLALASDPEVKERLKTATQSAVDRGVFGAPTFFVGDQMFWGQDRIDFVKEALQ